MSRRRKATHPLPSSGVFQLETVTQPELDPVHLFGSEDTVMNGAEIQDIGGVQVKFEPDDPEYEAAVGGMPLPAVGLVRAFPTHVVATAPPPAPQSSPKVVQAQVRRFLEDKTVDPKTASQSVEDVIENLLKRNEHLLAMNDTNNFKPYARRGRVPGEIGRSRDVVFPNPGCSTTFATGPQLQARITPVRGRPPLAEQSNTVSMGQLMRPKSPTRKCSILEKDKSHIALAMMETKVGCEDGEKIFRVQKHEMVCAISSKTKFMDKKGQMLASLDIHFYWCNFCSFSTTSKGLLMQHMMEHRFHCKHCRYQSFARSDIVHHSIHSHPEFQEQASVTLYCTFLSDYLRIHNPREEALDISRKRQPPDDDDQNSQPAKKAMKGYDMFHLSMEYLDENGEDGDSTAPFHDSGSRVASTSSSSVSVVSSSSQPDLQTTSSPAPMVSLLSGRHTVRQTASPGPLVSFKSSKSQVGRSSPGPVPVNSMTVLRPMSPVSALESETSRPVISQVFSGSNIPASVTASHLTRHDPNILSVNEDSASSADSAGIKIAGARKDLYWSCGYCPFSSRTQTGIKSHSLSMHSGKPYKYVALIKAEDSSPPPQDAEGDSASKSKTLEADVAGEAAAVEGQDSSDTDRSQADEPPVLIKQEPVEPEKETVPPIKIRFPNPRNQSKDGASLKCYHCNYSTRVLAHLRSHIVTKHPGQGLVGQGGMNSKVFMCSRTPCTFRTSSGQTFLRHADDCTPWRNGEAPSDAEPNQLECLRATAQIAEDPAASSPKVSYEKFSCIYCKCQYLGSKKQTKHHVLKYHGSKCLVMRNVQAHSKKRRSSVFFCRWCQWQADQKADYDLHVIFCSHQPQPSDTNQQDEVPDELDEEQLAPAFNLDIVSDVDSDAEPPDITQQDHLDTLNDQHLSPTPDPTHIAPLLSCVNSDQDIPELGTSDPGGGAILSSISSSHHTSPIAASHHFKKSPSIVKLVREKCVLKSKNAKRLQAFGVKKRGFSVNCSPKIVLKHSALKKKKGEAKPGMSDLKSLVNKKLFESHTKYKLKYSENKNVTAVHCCSCSTMFDSLYSLKSHLVSEHQEQKAFFFNSLYHRERHLKSRFYLCPFPDCYLYRYAESDVVQHYRSQHSHYPHHYLDCDYRPATVQFHCRRDKTKGSSKSMDRVVVKTEQLYMCLYCHDHYYTDNVPQMKSHHVAEHPGLDIVFRDMLAYKEKRASRLSVCHLKHCHFSSFEKDSLAKHNSSQHPVRSSDSTFDLSVLRTSSRSPQAAESGPADKSFQCTTCGWITAEEDAVAEHVSSTHASEGGSTIVTFDLMLASAIDERFVSV